MEHYSLEKLAREGKKRLAPAVYKTYLPTTVSDPKAPVVDLSKSTKEERSDEQAKRAAKLL
jgi:hypothetical protein